MIFVQLFELVNNFFGDTPLLYPPPNARPRVLLLQDSFSQEARIHDQARTPLLLTPSHPKPIDPQSCSVVPTLHCADTCVWRKRMIEAACHQIIISGNYCGGKAFDELLELINARMDKVPDLKVIILGHPQFIQDSEGSATPHLNKQLLWQLSLKFPERFHFIECPDTYRGKNKFINHAKFTVIDFGKYVCLGGSGLKDNFTMTGLDDLTVEEYLEEEILSAFPEQRREVAKVKRVASKKIPGNFRDQDFIFYCHDPEQRKVIYREVLWLANLWDQYNQTAPHVLPKMSTDLKEVPFMPFPALTDVPTQLVEKENRTVLDCLLRNPLPDVSLIQTEFPELETKKIPDVKTEFFFTGPDNQKPNPFASRMLKKIEAASKQIIISHMHFQPPKNILNALKAAAKRGVKITVVTAGVTKNCPDSQKIFGPKNRLHYENLLESLSALEKMNVQIYLFEQDKKGLHKKVVLIDESLFAGSSNFDLKCLQSMGDHEIDFIAESQSLVEQVQRIIDIDIAHSRLISSLSSKY